MRIFTIVVSAIFVAIGTMSIVSGDSDGWLIAGFFALTLLVGIFDPWFRKPWAGSGYRLLITEDEVACEHLERPRESIRWGDVIRIWYVTTSSGPWSPDEWLLFEGRSGGCSLPTEAKGIEAIWDELENRFPGFDYAPIIRGPTEEARSVCWERGPAGSGDSK